jgi:predicted TIM-barrel fold metal-dependent hydrolase
MSEDKLIMVSSDGHATNRPEGYKAYIPAKYHEEYDRCSAEYLEKGGQNYHPRALAKSRDAELVEKWEREVIEPGHLEGDFDPEARLKELESAGIVAEVLFPDFGQPFEVYSPTHAAIIGHPGRTPEQVKVGDQAYMRWVKDFISIAPSRFAPVAKVEWGDVDHALAELRWAKDNGFRGALLPLFSHEEPLFAPKFEPIWELIEDLDLIVHTHGAMSSTWRQTMLSIPQQFPHPSVGGLLFFQQLMFGCRTVLAHLIWGAVLERHPRVTVVLTEQRSGWVLTQLAEMDFQYEKSYLRSDIKELLPVRPSEYFERQVFLGSSLLSRAEVEARREIGIDKMMVGSDYPHHEGFWAIGSDMYLRATLGAAHVPVDEARKLLGLNAIDVYGFDRAELAAIADRVGRLPADILTPPPPGVVLRGDIEAPLYA